MIQNNIWGFDLGTTSIGWAIIDKTSKLPLAGGVRIIPGPTDDESPAAVSRGKRHTRRQKERKSMRKKAMIACLQAHKLFPTARLEERQEMRLNTELQAFFSSNPYRLRAEGLTRPLEHFELGRVFYHLVQRRGFPFGLYLDG